MIYPAMNITAVAGARTDEQALASGLFITAFQVGCGVILESPDPTDPRRRRGAPRCPAPLTLQARHGLQTGGLEAALSPLLARLTRPGPALSAPAGSRAHNRRSQS